VSELWRSHTGAYMCQDSSNMCILLQVNYNKTYQKITQAKANPEAFEAQSCGAPVVFVSDLRWPYMMK
jgi:hypothetical protein